MRYLVGFMCVLALGVMGCGETAGTGGSGGEGGTGGEGGSGGGGVACEGNVCPCTEAGIRAAIAEGGGPFTFDCDGPTTVVTEAEIVIDNDVILDGEGNLTVSGGEEDRDHRIFRVGAESGRTAVTLDGITVMLGSAAGFGGDGIGGGLLITNGSDVTLRNSTVSTNRATESGGGITVGGGTLTLIDSTVMHNRADRGAGIAYAEAAVTLSNSTVWQNFGGGIGLLLTDTNGTLALTNSTVSGNSFGETAGGIEITQFVSMTLTNSTVSDNTGVDIYGGFHGELTLTNSVIDGECSEFGETQPVSQGYNIESPGDTCGFDQPTDQVNVSADDLKLGELGDNGGPTMTHALLPGSVAIDVIPADMCEVDEDQRGEPRPGGTMCDVGAFEVQP